MDQGLICASAPPGAPVQIFIINSIKDDILQTDPPIYFESGGLIYTVFLEFPFGPLSSNRRKKIK